MVRPYILTPEDKLLLDCPFTEYRGQRIDNRWAGGWLTPLGTFLPVDYRNGMTHEVVAAHHLFFYGSGSISSQPIQILMMNMCGWMRISYLEYSSFCVELKGALFLREETEETDESSEFVISGDATYWIGTTSELTKEDRTINDRTRRHSLLSFIREYSRFDRYFINNTGFDSFKAFRHAITTNQVHPRSKPFKPGSIWD